MKTRTHPQPAAPNLTQRPPRSPRVRLGGYAMLPRILDWDILQWVNERANPRRLPHEIHSWSSWLETMPVGDAQDLEWFAAQAQRLNPARTDLHTIMDYLDADDHA